MNSYTFLNINPPFAPVVLYQQTDVTNPDITFDNPTPGSSLTTNTKPVNVITIGPYVPTARMQQWSFDDEGLHLAVGHVPCAPHPLLLFLFLPGCLDGVFSCAKGAAAPCTRPTGASSRGPTTAKAFILKVFNVCLLAPFGLFSPTCLTVSKAAAFSSSGSSLGSSGFPARAFQQGDESSGTDIKNLS